MIKAVLCDDEYIVVEALKVLVDWQALGIELAGTAQDGTHALALIREHKPEIVLTDIRMPGLDGLQLVEIIKEELPLTACIIFSGFNDYHYVKQAIQIGVIDYLEKPITESAIEKSIKKVKEVLEHQQKLQLLNEQVKASRYEAITMRLKEMLLLQADWEDQLELEEGKQANSYTAFTVCVSDQPFHADLFQDVLLFSFTHHKYAINVLIGHNSDNNQLLEWLEMSNTSEQYIGVGATYGEMNKLKQSFEEALLAYDSSMRLERSRIVSIREISSNENNEQIKQEMNELIQLRTQLLKAIVDGNLAQFKSSNDSFIAFCERTKLNMPFIENEILFILLALSKSSIVPASSSLMGTTLHGMNNRMYSLSNSSLIEWYKQQVAELARSSPEQGAQRPSSIIRAIEYIEQNCDKDLTLQEVAELVGLHPAYFSMLFKETTGENFVKYRTKTKIEYAKKLLTAGKNVSEVCDEVGFLTYRHFSSVFKQYTGLTPGKFKEQYFKMSNGHP